jgi:peptide/nickel transport system substrate-binding protein
LRGKKHIWSLAAVMLAMSVLLAACGGDNNLEEAMQDERNNEENNNTEGHANNDKADGEPQEGGDITIGVISDPVMFLPTHTQDSASSDVEEMLFNQLVRVDENIEMQKELAVDWEESDDGLTYTFEIHEGVTFHDGEPLTAEDVEFTFNIFLDEDYTGPRAGNFRALEEVEALDETTIEFRLSEPDARFISNLGGDAGILPKHLLEDVDATELEEHDFARNPIGSGPFQFDSWQDGQYVQLTAYEDYWEGAPHLERITFSIVGDQNALMAQIEGGDVDVGIVPATDYSTAEGWEEQGLVNLQSTLGYQYNYMGYNLRLDMFSDKETRQALTHAIDRQTIIDQVGQGQGEVAHGPVSPLSWAYPDEMPEFEYDPEKARELLAEAGWEEGADGILERDGERFSFTLKTNSGNQIREDISVVVQSMLNEVGVEVEVEYVEWGAFIDQINPPNFDFDAVVLGWSLGTDPDPRAIWHSEEIEAGLNNIGYARDDVDELIDKNVLIVDQDERAEALDEIFQMIAEDQPYTFLYYPNDLKVIPTNLEGFVHHPRLNFYRVQDWYYSE